MSIYIHNFINHKMQMLKTESASQGFPLMWGPVSTSLLLMGGIFS